MFNLQFSQSGTPTSVMIHFYAVQYAVSETDLFSVAKMKPMSSM